MTKLSTASTSSSFYVLGMGCPVHRCLAPAILSQLSSSIFSVKYLPTFTINFLVKASFLKNHRAEVVCVPQLQHTSADGSPILSEAHF
jgi:hypothetical protein